MWHTPWWYLIILFNLIIYVIVAMIVSHRATVDIGLCARHKRRRRMLIALCWLIALASIALCIFGVTDEQYVALIVVGLLGFLLALIVGVVGAQTIYPTRIVRDYVWLARVNRAYLAELPNWRG